MSKFFDKIKEINNFDLSKRLFPVYVFNKNLFRFSLIICLLLLLSIFSYYNFDLGTNYYLSCPNSSLVYCSNPYYDYAQEFGCVCPELGLCDFATLNPGDSYGVKPPFVVSNFGLIILTIFILTFAYNHIKYNWRVKK